MAANPMTSDEARARVERRWQRDRQGLDYHVEQVVRRAPALTAEQRDKLAVLLRGDAP